MAQAIWPKQFSLQGGSCHRPGSALLTLSVMARLWPPLLLLVAAAPAAPDVPATPTQGLRGAVSNSTGKSPFVAKTGLSDSGELNSTERVSCCKHGNDDTHCLFQHSSCMSKTLEGPECHWHGFIPHCCPDSDVGTAWFGGGCH
uniref:Uncharacterized protein n=1 Tax=Pyrodinium bahamense TaxID=73915 RepID=A0A7S0AHW2_9DINO